jgi:Ca-activated chloride channel homolog
VTLRVRTDRRLIRRQGRSNRYVVADITAPPTTGPEDHRQRPAVSLAFAIDRSGSMSGGKLDTALAAVRQSVARLRDDDRFSVIVFDDCVDVLVESRPADTEGRRSALELLRDVSPGNRTNLAEGWLRGAEQIAAHLVTDGVNKCLLLTDGLANVGIVDPLMLQTHAGELAERGVATSTFGLGEQFDEGLLSVMATAGGGNFYYLQDASAIAQRISSEVGEALDVVARDVALKVVAPPRVQVTPMSPYRVRPCDAGVGVVLGNLVSEQELDVVLKLSFPAGGASEQPGARFELESADGTTLGTARLGWRFADHAANDNQPRDRSVDRIVARQYAARARQEATHHNRHGDFSAARAAIDAVRRRIADYAGDDPELVSLVRELARDRDRLAAAMPEHARKGLYYQQHATLRSRMPSGAARRVSDGRSE